MARLDSETIGDIFRSALLVLAFWGLLSGLWPAIGGMTGQFAGAAESVTVTKELGVTTAPWDTSEAPSQSWIKVHVTSNVQVSVLIIALNSRNIRVQDVDGFASADDFLAVAKGTGTDVTLQGGHGGPVTYRVSVGVGPEAKAAGMTDANVSYSLTWEIQKMDPMVIVGGLVLFSMFFVTEYMLHMRRDIRSLSRRIEKLLSEGGVRAPIGALGAPVAVAPEEPEPAAEEPARGGFFGRRGGEAPARATEVEAPEPAPSRYGPPAAQPEAFAPSAFPPSQGFGPPAYQAPAAPAYQAPSYTPPPSYGPPPAAEPAPAPSFQVSAPPRAAAPPAAAPMAPEAPPGQEPVSKVRCPQCKHIVPVFTMERPTPIRCPNCGKRGMLTK